MPGPLRVSLRTVTSQFEGDSKENRHEMNTKQDAWEYRTHGIPNAASSVAVPASSVSLEPIKSERSGNADAGGAANAISNKDSIWLRLNSRHGASGSIVE